MLKKIMVTVAVCALLSTGVPLSAWAQTSATGPTGSAKAFVKDSLEFSLSIVKKMDPAKGETDPWNQGILQTTPEFDFGNLTPIYDTDAASPTYGQFLYMKGQYYYYVLLLASTSGRRYKITESGTQLQGPYGTLARESVLLYPDYQYLDELGGLAQQAMPSGAFLGTPNSATPLTESNVYQSDVNGESRIVRAILAITGPAKGDTYPTNCRYGHNGDVCQTPQTYTAWKPVTLSQRGGNYTGSMTFTLVLN